jgi:hypothetical protein
MALVACSPGRCVACPHMILVFWPQPHAASIIQPQPPAFGLAFGYFEPLTPPDAFDAFVIDSPACVPQHRRDPAIAVAPVAAGQLHDLLCQHIFIITDDYVVSLRTAGLMQHLARPPLRNAAVINDMINRPASARRAQKYPDATSFRIAMSMA